MTIKINHKKTSSKNSSNNHVLFTDEKFNINNLKKNLSDFEFTYVNDLLKTSDLKKNLLVFELTSKKKIILVSIKKNIRTFDIENLGAEFYVRVNYGKNSEYSINSDTIISNEKNFIAYFLHGLNLKSYDFNKYKSKKDNRVITLNVFGNKNKLSANTL